MFTCIILSHDKPKYVWDAINSIRNQIFTDWECILFDSGVLYDIGFFKELEQDKRFNIVRSWETTQLSKRKTIASWCFNECFREGLVHGKYVTYLCDDDLLYPNAYQDFYNFFQTLIGKDAKACYAAVDQTITDEQGNRIDIGEIGANGIRGSCVNGSRMDLFLDYLQICHSVDLLKEFPSDEYWPEHKDHVTHADGLFMEKIGLFSPIYPIKSKIGENRKVQSSLNGGGELHKNLLQSLRNGSAATVTQKPDPSCIVRFTPWPGRVLPDGRVMHEPGSPLWDRAKNGITYPTSLSTSEIYLDFAASDDAHNRAARNCLDLWNKPPEFIFLLDRWVIPGWDCIQRLLFHARMRPDYDIYAGVVVKAGNSPPDPMIYTSFDGYGSYWDWTVGDVLTSDEHGIKWTHLSLTLIRCSVFQKLLNSGLISDDGINLDGEPWFKNVCEHVREGNNTKLKRIPEETRFAEMVLKIGGRILVATEVQSATLDLNTGQAYGLPGDVGPVKRARDRQQVRSVPTIEPFNLTTHQHYWKRKNDETEVEMIPLIKRENDKDMFCGYAETTNIRSL